MSKAKPKKLKIRSHRYLTEMDLRRVHFFRYGTEEPSNLRIRTFKEVSVLAKLPIATCYHALKRYERDGYRFVDRRRMNFRKAWPDKVKIKGQIAEYLLNPNVLNSWAGFSLKKRCHELSKLGVNVMTDTLSKFYKRNKVRYVVCKYQYQQAKKHPPSKLQAFAIELAKRTAAGENIVYFDETSCNMWMRRRMTWSSQAKPVKFQLNKLRGKGVTILGAIGEYLPKAVFTLAPTTNKEHVVAFFKKLRSVVTPNPMTPKKQQQKLVVVLDNHRAHCSTEVTTIAK